MGKVVAVNVGSPDTIASLLADWRIHLESEQKAERAVSTYLFAAEGFQRWLDQSGRSQEVGAIRREDIEHWTAENLKRLKPATVSLRWRALQQFFKWAEEVELIRETPMRKLHAPKVPEKVVPVLPPGAIDKLLKKCSGKDFRARRDYALIALMADTGMRLAEVANLRYTPQDPDTNDVWYEEGWLRIMGKGQRERRVPLARTTRAALSRYLLVRRAHPASRLRWLWLSGSKHARLTDSGIRQMVSERADEAKLGLHVHPHMLRHNYAHQMKVAGMSDEAIMSVAGWRSRSMLARYGSSAAAERAAAEHLRHSLVDNL